MTRRQARAAGMSDDQLRGRVSSGRLHRVGVHTYRSPFVPWSALGDLATLIIDIGTPCWASGPTAAALHGFDGFALQRPLHVTIPRSRQVRRAGVLIHTAGALDRIDVTTVGTLPVMSATRTLIDLGRTESADRLTAALDGALRDGLTSEEFLHRRIVELRSSGRYGIPLLLQVVEGVEASRGGHSWLERRFLRLLADHGLPRPRTQAVLTRRGTTLVRVDCHFAAQRLVVELLGYRWHRTRAQLAVDAERANALLLAGERVVQFTYEHVVRRPHEVIATLNAALQVPL